MIYEIDHSLEVSRDDFEQRIVFILDGIILRN